MNYHPRLEALPELSVAKGQTGTVSSGHSFFGGGIGELYWLTLLNLLTSS